jgi:hypothetical protein
LALRPSVSTPQALAKQQCETLLLRPVHRVLEQQEHFGGLFEEICT